MIVRIPFALAHIIVLLSSKAANRITAAAPINAMKKLRLKNLLWAISEYMWHRAVFLYLESKSIHIASIHNASV